MASYPRIQSPCPYKGALADLMEGDTCRLCRRTVFDITDWSDAQRVAFLEGCRGEVCVSYRAPLRIAGAAALAAAALAAPATAAQAAPDALEMVIVVGGISDPSQVEYVEEPGDASTPELPVVYDEDDGSPPAPAGGEAN